MDKHKIEAVGFGSAAYFVRGPLATRGAVYSRTAAIAEARRLDAIYEKQVLAHRAELKGGAA